MDMRGGLGALGAEGALDAGDIMVGHPVAHEGLGGADLQFVARRRIPGSSGPIQASNTGSPNSRRMRSRTAAHAAGQSGRIGFPVTCPMSHNPSCFSTS